MADLKSLRDCLEEGLQAIGRKTFLYQVVYVGQHDYENLNELMEYFRQNIHQCNSDYCDEKLTGFLLCYQKLLIHLLEGSEESIYQHFSYLCKKNIEIKIHDLKILIVWPHLVSRITNTWLARTGSPKESDNEVTSTYQASPFVQQCLKCMCKLASLIHEPSNGNQDLSVKSFKIQSIENIPDELISKLPDANQILFLTSSPVLASIQELYKSMHHIKMIPYTEVAWPTPSVYIPYDIAREGETSTN